MMKYLAFFFVLLTAVVVTAVHPSLADEQNLLLVELRINEIDYDQGLLDGTEFIEITNSGDDAASLDLYYLDLVDGAGPTIYQTIDLPNVTLEPGDYYVLCTNLTAVLNCDQTFTGSIQDGAPDAVALMLSGALIDTVSYEGETSNYTEGSGAEEDDGALEFMGISRYPDGVDTDNNEQDFSPRCISPGLLNLSRAANCSVLFERDVTVTLTAVPETLPEPGGLVTFTIRVASDELLAVTITSLTDNLLGDLDGEGSCQTPQSLSANDEYACTYIGSVSGVDGEDVTRSVTVIGEDQLDVSFERNGQTAVTMTPPVRWDVYLPILSSSLPYGEPNNTCDEAYSLLVNQTAIFLADDVDDWYSFELSQSGNVTVSLNEFIPAEGQLVVWRGACDDLEFVGSDGSTAVDRTLDLGTQPAGYYTIWVINDGPLNSTDPYSLHVQSP